MSQICLCRRPTAGEFTENGLCRFCNYCFYYCTEEDAFIYDQAVKKFLATKQPQPLCCNVDGIIHVKAKMRVKTDVESDDFGRPYFVCSKKRDPCSYFAWGDEAIIPMPLCEHGKPCHRQKEWKEGPNKGRYFFSCGEPSSYIPGRGPCKFFKWMEPEDQREIAEDTSAEFLRLNDEFPYYSDEVLKLMAERRTDALARNEEFNMHQEYMKLIRTKESLEKRIDGKELDNEKQNCCQEP